MTFTSLPEMFSSVFGPLAYTFSNAAETELFLEILSTRDGSRIGSKRFYNTPTGTLNIAPMVRKNIRFVPSSGDSAIRKAGALRCNWPSERPTPKSGPSSRHTTP